MKRTNAIKIIGKYDENWQPRNKEMDKQTKEDYYISFKEYERERMKDLMLAQLLGYRLGSKGFSIYELVSSAGLTMLEWEEIKNEIEVTNLSDDEKLEVEEYVNNLLKVVDDETRNKI